MSAFTKDCYDWLTANDLWKNLQHWHGVVPDGFRKAMTPDRQKWFDQQSPDVQRGIVEAIASGVRRES